MSGLWRLRIGISDRDIFPYGERGAGRERKISRHIAGSRSSANSLWQGGWRRAHSVRDCLPKWDFFSPTLAGRYRYTRSVAHWLPKWICGSVRDFVAQSAPTSLPARRGALAKHCYQGVTRPGGRYFVSVQPLPKASFRRGRPKTKLASLSRC